jgi:ABC-2 type transport system permease protein
MSKYWAIAKTSLQNSMAYRADFLFWGLNELFDTFIFLFIWITIYGEGQAIGGFSLSETVTYLIGAGLIGSLIFSQLGYTLEGDVKSGRLSDIATKPVIYPLARVVSSLAEKPFDLFIRLTIYFSIAYFFRGRFIVNLNGLDLLLVLLSVVLAYMINNLINFCFGCLAFWTTSINRGIFACLRTVIAVFSGAYAPLAFFPFWFQQMAKILPFSYTRYFPMLIYLRKITTIEAGLGILFQIVWIVALFFLSRLIWAKGIKKYEGVGI